MDIYQVRQRRLRAEAPLTFPGTGHLRFHFATNAALGGEKANGIGNVVRQGVPATLEWNANIGRQTASSEDPLEPLDVVIEAGEQRVELRGHVLTVKIDLPSREFLHAALETLYYILPISMNVELSEPAMIVMVDGDINNVPFLWELARGSSTVDVTNAEEQERRFLRSWERVNLISDPQNKRLLRSLHYFHLAVRLSRIGQAPWDFMGEVVLNLCKALEALLPPIGDGKTRQAVRAGLASVGYTDDEIERDFIPMMALRDRLDIAHVSLAAFAQPDLLVIHRYTEEAEQKFRSLFERLFAALADSSFSLVKYDDNGPDPEALKIVRRISQHLQRE